MKTNVIQLNAHRSGKRGHKGRPAPSLCMLGKGLPLEAIKELLRKFGCPLTEADYRNRALLLTMLYTGLRSSAIVRLKRSSMIELNGRLHFEYVKKGGKKAISSDLPAPVIQAIEDYRLMAGLEGDHLFQSLPLRRLGGGRTVLSRRSLQRIVNDWGVRTERGRLVHPHALRHTAGQMVFDKGGSIMAQKFLGHSTPVTTSKFYTRAYTSASHFFSVDN